MAGPCVCDWVNGTDGLTDTQQHQQEEDLQLTTKRRGSNHSELSNSNRQCRVVERSKNATVTERKDNTNKDLVSLVLHSSQYFFRALPKSNIALFHDLRFFVLSGDNDGDGVRKLIACWLLGIGVCVCRVEGKPNSNSCLTGVYPL